MPIGGQNQANRVGHGVLQANETLAGQVAYAAPGEKSLATIIDAVATANGKPAFAPYEVRLLFNDAVTGGELRTKTTVPGFPINHEPAGGAAGDPSFRPTTFYFAQNSQAPNDFLIFANAPGTLYVLLIG